MAKFNPQYYRHPHRYKKFDKPIIRNSYKYKKFNNLNYEDYDTTLQEGKR